MPLTDLAVKSAKAAEKQRKISDEKGLYLLVTAKGGKLWRLKYRFGGKEKVLAIGVYPDVRLADARNARDAARKLLANGIDPNEYKKTIKLQQIEAESNSLEMVAREWFAKQARGWTESHANKVMGRLEKDIFAYLGSKAIPQVAAPGFRRERMVRRHHTPALETVPGKHTVAVRN
ncbi:MAG: integrase arm-type DNA-binding domain-containing protein [Gammaproteobacteria bacterium]|jgi:hypothetical protein